MGEASVDLHTIATGARTFVLSFDSDVLRGSITFSCFMSELQDTTVTLTSLQLCIYEDIHTHRLCEAARKGTQLQIYPSIKELLQADLYLSSDNTWNQPCALTFCTSLWNLIGPSDNEHLRVQVLGEDKSLLGEAIIPFIEHFTLERRAVAVNVDVMCVEGGVLGELTGFLRYYNLPSVAQLAGGMTYGKGRTEGGYVLVEGLPIPYGMNAVPVLGIKSMQFEENEQNAANDSPVKIEFGCVKRASSAQLTQYDTMEDVALPCNWEMHVDRETGRPYFLDHRSKLSTFTDPRFLPNNWVQKIDTKTGEVQYLHHKTQQATSIDPRGCHSSWSMRLSASGDVYFAHHPTEQTTFKDPRGLPKNWMAALDTKGRMYFKNHESKSTQWDDPRESGTSQSREQWRLSAFADWWAHNVNAYRKAKA